jgi:hypothetical protein
MEDSYTIKKINKEGIDWEKIIVKLVYNDELVSSIYLFFSKSIIKTTNPIKNEKRL